MESRIGKYEIQSEIGIGGFGHVYRAYDPSVRRPVAIKVLSPEGDPDLLARFRAEAGMTGKLQHKNIVTVFDCGEQNGSPYLVMEYLEGENLQALLRSGKSLGLLEKMWIISQIADGLHYAHQSGVIHRDIKPANIMLLPSGVVKIMDFGVARMVDIGPSRRTRAGDLISATSYMSPEQFRGSEPDSRSDIFAFGVVCYELLSGIHPFQSTDVSAVIYRIMSVEPLPLREVCPECPEALESLVHRALAKDRDFRYSSFDDIFIDVEPILLDLRRERATQMLAQVNALTQSGEFEQAQTALKHALELDPFNAEARRLKLTLQEERSRKSVEQNIQALEHEGNAKLSGRFFSEALQIFENAVRLSPHDDRLKGLVEDTRAKLQASRESGRLMMEAKREAQNKHFPLARDLVLQALEADPQQPEAPALLKQLDAEIERAQKMDRSTSGIAETERLLNNGAYDLALEHLQSLEDVDPQSEQIASLRNRIRSRQMEDYRRKQAAWLESELSRAKQLQGQGAFPEAVEVLDRLLADLPGFTAIEQLRKAIHNEIGAQQRAANMASLMQSARDLLAHRQLPEALALLDEGLKTFPGDTGVRQLYEAARLLHVDAARQESLAQIASQARALRGENRLEEALTLLKTGLKTHGSDTVLADMGRIAILEQESRRAFDKLQRYRESIQELLAAGSLPEAQSLLSEARDAYPLDPTLELFALMQQPASSGGAEAGRDSLQREAEAEKALAGVREHLTTGNLEAAAALLAQLEPAHGSEEAWQIERKNLDRRHDLLERLRNADALRQNGNYAEAETTLQQLLKDDPANEQASGLLQQVTAARRLANPEEVIRSQIAAAEKLAFEGDLPAAANLLTRLSEQFPHHRGVRESLERVRTQLGSTSGTAFGTSSGTGSRTGDASRLKSRFRFAEALFSAAQERPPSRVCAKCNVLLPDGARFCDTCGTPVP